MKIYVDGDVQPTTGSSGILTAKLREYHTFGAPNPESPNAEQFDGTIAFLRFWHGEALDADQVAELYAAREAEASTRRARRLQGSAERAAAEREPSKEEREGWQEGAEEEEEEEARSPSGSVPPPPRGVAPLLAGA